MRSSGDKISRTSRPISILHRMVHIFKNTSTSCSSSALLPETTADSPAKISLDPKTSISEWRRAKTECSCIGDILLRSIWVNPTRTFLKMTLLFSLAELKAACKSSIFSTKITIGQLASCHDDTWNCEQISTSVLKECSWSLAGLLSVKPWVGRCSLVAIFSARCSDRSKNICVSIQTHSTTANYSNCLQPQLSTVCTINSRTEEQGSPSGYIKSADQWKRRSSILHIGLSLCVSGPLRRIWWYWGRHSIRTASIASRQCPGSCTW